MKFSLQWLKDYVAVGFPPEKLAHRLTMAGLEVEKIETVVDDTVFELEITPNRPDCLNILGIAREVSAILNKKLKYPKVRKMKFPSRACDIAILDKESCSRYVGTVIEHVNVGAAPAWLQKRINVLGIRSINNVVDVTNFCLMETGQPLHAFDYDKLLGHKIVVRRARQGEQLTTIDGVTRTLDPSILVIADAQRAVAIAGIMGGKETGVTETTKNILLESAWFDPVVIRRAARRLGLSSDSSYRFERGVDLNMVEAGAARAVALIREHAGGVITQRQDVFPVKRKIGPRKIVVSKNQINALLGASFSSAECKTILKKLEFRVSVDDRKILNVIPPSFRNDVTRPVDVVEEVARIAGYDNLPSSLPVIRITNTPVYPKRILKRTLRETMTAQGFLETITYSLSHRTLLQKTRLEHLEAVAVQNPLTQEQEIMRPHMLPSLLSVVVSNFNRGRKDLRLFELGKIYSAEGEKDVLAFLMTGTRDQDWRILGKESVDFYDLKGAAANLFEKLKIDDVQYPPYDYDLFVPGQSTMIIESISSPSAQPSPQSQGAVNPPLGFLGKIKKEILNAWDIKSENVLFGQIYVERLLREKSWNAFRAVSDYPSIVRDVSLAVNKDVSFQRIKDIARREGEGLLHDVSFLEQYLGDKIPAGQRGLVFSLTYQSPHRTLTDEEVNKAQQRICQSLAEDLGAVLR